MELVYKHDNKIVARIYVDYIRDKVKVINYTDNFLEKPFGANDNPTIKDFEDLVEDRCFPRSRDMMKLHLQELGIGCYEPLDIIRQTQGKLEGDYFSLEIVKE